MVHSVFNRSKQHCLGKLLFNLVSLSVRYMCLIMKSTIRFCYKLAIFKCMNKACNGRLPSTLTNCIAKKRNLSCSIRARDSSLVTRFNTRFMKDSVAFLWNMLSSRYTDLADISLCNLVKKLKTSDLFKAADLNALSGSTVSFEHQDFVYN